MESKTKAEEALPGIEKQLRDAEAQLSSLGVFKFKEKKELREKIESLIDALGLKDKIFLPGFDANPFRYIARAEMFVLPSFYEGFPGAVLEAETSGLPCIIADTITSEVVLTRQVKRIPLSKGACFWAQMINTFVNIERENAWKDVLNAGYDINDLTDRLEQLFDAMT